MNNELIKVEINSNGNKAIDGRELHEFLEIGSRYNDWFNRMIEYGFVENIDFEAITQEKVTAQGNKTTLTTHLMTISMAKEIAMIQRSDKGKQARLYFIECEKELKKISLKSDLLLAIYNGGQEGILASKQLTEIEVENATKPLVLKIEQDKPKVEFTKKLLKSKDCILVREYSKVLFDEGINIGEKRLYKWLRDNKYLMENNEPYQNSMKYFRIKEGSVNTPFGIKITKTTTIIPEGQVFFYSKLKTDDGNSDGR